MTSSQEFVTLRDYFERRLVDLQQRLDAYERSHVGSHEALQIAVSKSETAFDVRMAIMNEWRGTVSDIMAGFARKESLEALEVSMTGKLESMSDRLRILERFAANTEGRITAVGIVASLAGVGVSIALNFLR